MANTQDTLTAIKAALSAPRISTYESATHTTTNNDPSAIALYAWNATVSSALLAPLHICEVVIRNAVSEAIERLYGPQWPWSAGFARSLSTPAQPWLYDPRKDLINTGKRFQTTGKVIPELKFVFWQQMFDSRHEARIWNRHLVSIFPNVNTAKAITDLRQDMHDGLEQVRTLRNRIAHHEPIFARNLQDDFQTIIRLVRARSEITASWLLSNQIASVVMSSSRPFLGGSMWTPSHEEIAAQAYRFWRENGHPEGHDLLDWTQAEDFLHGTRWWDF